METKILTLPLTPVSNDKYGKYVTPVLCDTLKQIYGAEYIHCINLLDSFNDRESRLDGYISSLEDNKIGYDSIWIDEQNIDKMLEKVYTLIDLGLIQEMQTDLCVCDCGIVEIEKSKIPTCNPNSSEFFRKDDKLFCKKCGTECRERKTRDILGFTPRNINVSDISIYPYSLSRKARCFDKTVINSYTTITRERDTGIVIEYNGKKYNLDIDFLWSTYLSTFDESEKIVVSGNKLLYQLFMVGLVEKSLNPDSKTLLVGTPYVSNINSIVNDPNFQDSDEFKKLATLYNMRWRVEQNDYNPDILKWLKKLTDEERRALYDFTCSRLDENVSPDSLTTIINNRFSQQKGVQFVKKRRNN